RDAVAHHPFISSAVLNAEATELTITDIAGLEVSFIPNPPDALARTRTDAELEQDAAARASEWDALLAGGGLILIPTEGPTLTAAATAAVDLVAQIDEAIALPAAERETRLLELLTHETVVTELIANYQPAAQSSRPRPTPPLTANLPAQDTDPRAFPVALSRQLTALGNSSVNQAAGTISQPPGKPEAYVFATLYDADSDPFTAVLQSEGYQVWGYDSLDSGFGGRGFEYFLSTSGTGALYLATHGSPRGVSVESFANQADAGRVHTRLSRTQAGNFGWWTATDGTWWLTITVQGLQNLWQSNNTIVHAAICNSNSLNAGFQAREYFSYQPTTSCAIATPDTTLLWQRMSGQQGNGAFRPASIAFGQGGFSGGFRHNDGSPEDDTVVSPGVLAFSNIEIPVGQSAFVTIKFDAYLDATVPSKALTRITGCIQPAGEASYEFQRGEFGLIVPVTATTIGTGGVTVIANMTRSPGLIHLDGNQNPVGTNHVAQNRDDYVGSVTCVSAGIATPSPTTGLQPPTPEPTSTTETEDPTEPPETEIPDPSTDATPHDPRNSIPPNKVLVFYLGGVFYDATGLVSIEAHLPFCSYLHVHGGPIAPVLPTGGSSASEHLGECGFGPPNFYLIDRPN
ncbi:MAG: hypothetical protein HOH95_10985, partial [Dehalococcoidia bacterium]|nr:hypothetical protein [Dehalococcoidia bacterium]